MPVTSKSTPTTPKTLSHEKWGIYAIKGIPGAQVIPDLKPEDDKDYIVEKRTYSGFYETRLRITLTKSL